MTWIKVNRYLAGAWGLIALLGCKPRILSNANTKSLTATHVMQAEFTEATGKITYSLVGTDAEKEEIKSVKVSQLKSADKAVFYKGKINSNFLMGYDQDKKFYPSYAMEIVTTSLNCRTLDSAWMGSKEIDLNCVRSTAQNQQSDNENNKPEPSPSTTGPTSQTSRTPSPTKPANSIPSVPSSAAECSGAKVRSYAVCRFFEGGHYGCFEKHRCITRMSPTKCSIIKADLKNQYPWMASRWDCTAGVAP